MQGSFSQESLDLYSALLREREYSVFSEEDRYDFTRCVRPDGTAYGTGGKCKKGKEEILRELNERPLKMNPLSGLLKSFKDNRKVHLPSAPTDSLVVLGNKLSGSQSKTEDKSLLEKVVKELSKRSDYPTQRWEWWMFD